MTFEEAGKILNSRQDFVKKDGLARPLACLEKLGNPHLGLKTIHVTGTNGKGSACALFEAAARAAGLRTGLFISPHLISPAERIRFGGENIGEKEFTALFEEVYAAGPALGFFELLTCMAFLYFARKKTDLAVIEVGIGGRFDTTNVLPGPELSVITSVDYDHKKYLGDTLAEIASQKAGIIKPGGVCVAPILPPEARAEISREAAEKAAQCHFFAPVFEIAARDWEKNSLALRHKKTGEVYPFGILGEAQVSNVTLVWEGLELLRGKGWPISRAHAAAGFASVRWPARFQVLGGAGRKNIVIVDGAHNDEAARAFAATWKASPFAARPAAFVVGMLQDKERRGILELLAPLAKKFIFTRPDSPRAADPCVLADELSAIAPAAEVEVQEDIGAALSAAERYGTAAVLGSFYLAGSALEILGVRDNYSAGRGRPRT
ncbi:MAG: bifunctional folylpolyglutamate synthase/dihydrofolate synthase [Elusimicrobia bacterium]|nr:bifunctional folylpolyglutamate synthase/dihydrofolate synthase [Elusimicrobiota bacterium]